MKWKWKQKDLPNRAWLLPPTDHLWTSQVPQPTCYWHLWQLGNLTTYKPAMVITITMMTMMMTINYQWKGLLILWRLLCPPWTVLIPSSFHKVVLRNILWNPVTLFVHVAHWSNEPTSQICFVFPASFFQDVPCSLNYWRDLKSGNTLHIGSIDAHLFAPIRIVPPSLPCFSLSLSFVFPASFLQVVPSNILWKPGSIRVAGAADWGASRAYLHSGQSCTLLPD